MQMALGFFSTSFIALDPIFFHKLSSGPTREQFRNAGLAGHRDANPALTQSFCQSRFPVFRNCELSQDPELINSGYSR
jgi:hypothetical protein